MSKKPMCLTVLSACAALATSFALVACGGGGDDSGATELAKYAPADTLYFADATVRPDADITADIDGIAQKLTGTTVSEALNKALDSQTQVGGANSDFSYDIDIAPWLGDNVAFFGTADLSNTSDLLAEGMPGAAAVTAPGATENFGVVAQSTDEDAAQAFITKASKGEDTTENEYEGNKYLIDQSDDTALGMVDGNVVVASDADQFKAIVDASSGDSLADSAGFKDVAEEASDSSVLNIYAANEPILKASGEDQFPGIKDVYSALGVDVTDSASLLSVVPSENQVSIEALTNTDTDIAVGDASELISTFPSNSVFAAGVSDVGENVTKVIDALDESGIEGILQPGELKKNISAASEGGLDVPKIIASIQDIGFFVSGTTEKNLGGALVMTTNDPEPLQNVLQTFSTLLKFSTDTSVKPLGGGQTGFLVRTPDLPGRPVVLAIKDERLVVAIGLPAANQILNGGSQSLADNTAFTDAQSALGDNSLDLFADPAGIASLLRTQPGSGTKEAADTIEKFHFMASGHGESDNTSEFILNLAD